MCVCRGSSVRVVSFSMIVLESIEIGFAACNVIRVARGFCVCCVVRVVCAVNEELSDTAEYKIQVSVRYFVTDRYLVPVR